MKPLVISLVALGIGCATSRPVPQQEAARVVPLEPIASPPTTTAVEAAAEYALTTYVDESTRTQGVVCVELDGREDTGKVLARLTPLAGRLSVDRKDCLGRDEPSAILSIGPPQLAGDRARVDVGVVLGSAGMLELERREGTWKVVRVTRPWISLR